MRQKPIVSIIIIDYKRDNPLLQACLDAIWGQTYPNFEVILVTDYPISLAYPKLIKKSFGRYVGPAEKRDWGGKKAKGEILAFIDDDAYPDKNWLKNLVKNFSDPEITAVGGPGVTPPKVSWREAASGWMSASPIGAGPYIYRFLPGKRQVIDDYPSMNLAVRRSDFLAVGGYDSHYWPGEDTKLCLDLIKTGKKIVYDPKALVFHHRRPIWLPHLRQNGNFGLHRGFFARILPQTSFRPAYFGPSVMVLGVIYLFSARYLPVIYVPDLIAIGYVLFTVYLFALAANSLWIYRRSNSLFQSLVSFPSVIITHTWYGLRFLQGYFFTKKLSR